SDTVRALAAQRLGPLGKHLGGVEHLLVVPTGWAARIPLEVLTGAYRVSYVPSGSLFARLRRGHRPLRGTTLLALADPAFRRPPANRPQPPASGVLLASVKPGGPAHRSGLREGDVVLQVGKRRIGSLDELKQALGAGPAPARYWREGAEATVTLPGVAL